MYIYIYTWPHVFVYVFMCVYMRIPDCSQDRAAASFGEVYMYFLCLHISIYIYMASCVYLCMYVRIYAHT